MLCEDLSISKINTAGIPDNVMKTLILDVKFDERYFERVIHHEVFHIINDSYKEIFDQKIQKDLHELKTLMNKRYKGRSKTKLDTSVSKIGSVTPNDF